MKLNRRSFFILAGTLFLVPACGATPTPQAVYGPPGQGPRFAVDRRLIDFGNVKFDKMVSAVFKVTNTGTAPLTLKVPSSVRAEVGC